MKTALKFGPVDHGRPVEREEWEHAEWETGYQYEIIDGRIYVSPLPNRPWWQLEMWLLQSLLNYSREHPEVVDCVTNKARVRVPGAARATYPEPDLAAYHDFPYEEGPDPDSRWEDVHPFLVGEVLSPDDPDKDLVRNVGLYEQVPSIKEYWIVDTRDSLDEPSLIVYRRRGRRWQKPLTVPFGETYPTRLLPRFALVIDPWNGGRDGR